MAFTEVNTGQGADKFKFENPGDVLEGKYVGKAVLEFDDKDVNKYVFETPSGTKGVLGSFKIDEFMSTIQIGTLVRITYTKKERLKGGKTLKMFKFEKDESGVNSAA